MIYKLIPLALFVLFSFKTNPSISYKTLDSEVKKITLEKKTVANYARTYANLNHNNFPHPSQESFIHALKGYEVLKEKGLIQKEFLTLIDFSLSSTEKRLWVIDMKQNKILLQSFVAHGKNSGYEYASNFSNVPESHKSSLGFYATGETYYGKHGYSLRLDGLENGINHNARKRAIVIHGASYVSESFIDHNGRLGRSFGCPALPKTQSKQLIDLIKNKSCLYIYYPSES